MRDPARKTFQYQSTGAFSSSLRTRLIVESLRSWFFSPVGLVASWIAALGILLPAALLVIVTLHERNSVPLLTFGTWWLAGMIVIHWWIPAARQANRRTEGIAAAGWHVSLTMLATAMVAWFTLFRDGLQSPFTLGETQPVVVSWVFFTAILGVVVIRLRGHRSGRTLRYSGFALAIGAAWMSLWLVLGHHWM